MSSPGHPRPNSADRFAEDGDPPQARRRERSEELFWELARYGAGDEYGASCRAELVTLHLPLVEHCARRFADRGEALEDLLQVGTIGLIKSIDRFDVARGLQFSSFAVPTIVGEIKRHFRDKGWAVRVPRRLQELRGQLGAATDQLHHRLGREPSVAELAEEVGATEAEVRRALQSGHAYSTVSIDASAGQDGLSLAETLGAEESGLQEVETRVSLQPMLAALPDREREILTLRFFDNLTQSQIAARVGVSQMHVSRLLTRTLAQLRRQLDDG